MPDEFKSWWVGHENITSIDFLLKQKKIIVKMYKKGDPKIAKSLADTLEDEKIKSVLRKYNFPCTALEIKYVRGKRGLVDDTYA